MGSRIEHTGTHTHVPTHIQFQPVLTLTRETSVTRTVVAVVSPHVVSGERVDVRRLCVGVYLLKMLHHHWNYTENSL